MTKPEKKDFIKLFISTAVPVALQSLLQNSLSFVDTIMISSLGESPIAAVGLCGQVFFLVSIFLFGIGSGSGIFFNQFRGAKDDKGIQKTLGIAVICGEILAFIFSFASVVTPRFLMHCFVEDEEVVELGCSYLRWVGISYMFTALSIVLNDLLRALGRAKATTQITFVSMLCDVILNYLFIFVAGFGVAGAAIATAISRLVESVLLIVVVLKKTPMKFHFSELFSFDRKFVFIFFKTAVPVIIDDGLWALGYTVYKAVHAHMGVDVLAAANVFGSISDMFFVFANGFAAATAVLIGNEIGQGKTILAQEKSKLCNYLGIISGACMGLLMILTSSFVPKLFGLSDSVCKLTTRCLFWYGLLMPMKSLNLINTVGVLRSGGDTRFVFYLEIFTIWCVGVPLCFLSGLRWGFPLYFVIMLTNMEEVVKISISYPRFISKKWIHVLTDN